MDPRLATLKPGDVVTWIEPYEDTRTGTFVCLYRDGVIVDEAHGVSAPEPGFVSPDHIRWPEPLKAKPGVVYRRDEDTTRRVGLVDGRLLLIGLGLPRIVDFTPDWQEVTEP